MNPHIPLISRNFRAVGLAAALLVGVGCGGGVRPGHIDPERPVIDGLALIEAQPRTTPKQIEVSGAVIARQTAPVASKVMGKVVQVLVREGDAVRAGQPLLMIDDTDVQARIRQGEAAQAAGRAAAEAAEQAAQAAESQLAAARAQQGLAVATHQRFETLLARQAVSRQEYDQVAANRLAADAQVESAAAALAAARAATEQARAMADQAVAGLQEARSMVAYTRLTAPFAGRVAARLVDPGALATPGTPLLTLENTDHYQLLVHVDESRLADLTPQTEVTVDLPAAGGRLAGATVDEIVPQVDPATRTFPVKLALPPHPVLRGGLFGRAAFAVGHSETLAVPLTALHRRGMLEGVYVVDAEGVIRWRLVKTGRIWPDAVEILTGLAGGERLAIGPPERMVDGGRAGVRP